jgi:hypothetical protein
VDGFDEGASIDAPGRHHGSEAAWRGTQATKRTTPPSTRSAAPLVADACSEQA